MIVLSSLLQYLFYNPHCVSVWQFPRDLEYSCCSCPSNCLVFSCRLNVIASPMATIIALGGHCDSIFHHVRHLKCILFGQRMRLLMIWRMCVNYLSVYGRRIIASTGAVLLICFATELAHLITKHFFCLSLLISQVLGSRGRVQLWSKWSEYQACCFCSHRLRR